MVVYHYLRSSIALAGCLRSLNLCIMIYFYWLLTNLLSCRCSNRSWKLLNFFRRSWPNWNWWHNLNLLLLDWLLLLLRRLRLLLLNCWLYLLLLYKSLICNLWHFICFNWIVWLWICSLSTINSSSVCKNSSWPRSSRSLTTIKSNTSTSYWICGSSCFESSW